MTDRRTRVVFGSDVSSNYIDMDSKEIMEAVIQLPPAENKPLNDVTLFYLPSGATNNDRPCIIEAEEVPGKIRIQEVMDSCTPEVCYFPNERAKSKKEAFSKVTIHRETVKPSGCLLLPNSSYYQTEALTNRVQSTMTVDSYPITYETAHLWAAPVYDTEHPGKFIFQKYRGFVQLTIENKWVSTEKILDIIELNLPQLFLV